MTAVPAQRSKTKDPFQLELDKEIAKRRSRGLKTGFSDEESAKSTEQDDAFSDDYEEDFDTSSEDNSDEELLQEYLSSTTPMKTTAGASKLQSPIVKKVSNVVAETKEETDLSQTRKSPMLLTKQNAIEEKRDDKYSMENDSLLAYLNNDSQTAPPWKVKKSNESDSFHSELFGRQSTSKKKVTFVPTATSLSPREDAPFSTFPQPKTENSEHPSSEKPIAADTKLSKALLVAQDLSKEHDSKPKPAPRRSSDDELLKPQPKTRRRHDSNRSSMSDESVARSLTKSPELQKLSEENANDDAKHLDYDVSKFPSFQKPALQPIAKRSEKLGEEKHTSPKSEKKDASPEKSFSPPTERSKTLVQSDSDMTSSTEDLLAKLQAAADSKTPYKKPQVEAAAPEAKPLKDIQPPQASDDIETKEKSPSEVSTSEEDGEKIDQATFTFAQKESTEKLDLKGLDIKRPSSRRSTPRKSPRTPPVNYRGLGSLKGLQQLRTYRPEDTHGLKSTTDVRSTVYLQWLADREKQLKAKKKQKVEEEEKENEKKQKEMEDRILEGESARRAWMEKKEVILKEQVQKKKKEEKKLQREKEKEAEEKRKSAQKAEIVRERALTEAKKRHREELRKKKEEERERKQQEKEKKKKNEEELNKWMEKRSKQWERDRKQEIKEKKAKEKTAKKAKEEKSKRGEDGYMKWREKKEEQDVERRKVNRHDEDRPPWSPPNKVIPRVR